MHAAIAYPRLIKRVRAILIDSIIVPVAMFASLFLGDAMHVSSSLGKALTLLAPLFILEPGMVAFTGGTIGHHCLKLRVTRTDGIHRIKLFAATIRFAVLLVLGWFSFIPVFVTARHQGVHDLIARSIVIHKDREGLPAYDVLAECTNDLNAFLYPSRLRRIGIIIGYGFMATIGLVALSVLALSNACGAAHDCTNIVRLIGKSAMFVGPLVFGWIIVFGWSGRLYGARKRVRASPA